MDEEERERVPPNLRLFLILEEIVRVGTPMTPTEVNAALGLPKPTIHRLFATLEAEGLLQRELDGRSYSVGTRMRKLATNTLSSLRIRTPRLAVLNRLAEEIGETCNIAVPDRYDMIYLDRVETKWPLRIQLPIGTHVPFHCTASGKMYLSSLPDRHLERWLANASLTAVTPASITDPDALRAELETTRRNGYSRDAEEYITGMIAMAVPVPDDQGRLISTLSFHAPVERLALKDGLQHLDRMKRSAAELSLLVQG